MTKLAFENWISYFLGKMSLRPSNVEARKIVTKPKMWDGSYKGFSWAVLVNMISNLTGIGICVVSSTLNCLFSSVSLVCVCVCVCVCMYVCVCMHSVVSDSATPLTIAHRVPLSMAFSRQEYWVGCHFLLQGTFLTQGSNLNLLHWQADSLPLSQMGSL